MVPRPPLEQPGAEAGAAAAAAAVEAAAAAAAQAQATTHAVTQLGRRRKLHAGQFSLQRPAAFVLGASAANTRRTADDVGEFEKQSN